MVLGSTPTWNAKRIVPGDYPVPGARRAPKSIAAWDAFVTQVVKRYKGRITTYQIWNEASLVMFWDGTPEAMAELTKRAYDIIKEEDPKARVVAASTTVRLAGAFDRFFPSYLAALAELGLARRRLRRPHVPHQQGQHGRARRLHHPGRRRTDGGRRAGPAGVGHRTQLRPGRDPGPSTRGRPSRAPRRGTGSSRPTFDSLALGIARTYWYIWTSEPYPLLGMQLTNGSGAVKGLRIVDQWIVGGTTTGCTDDGSVTSCPVEKNGVPSVIAWADDESGTLDRARRHDPGVHHREPVLAHRRARCRSPRRRSDCSPSSPACRRGSG